ncbi:MAG TPA: histidine phosphatase family protein, partial [Clostridiales bacterium]|nr:histidine phosphatase family protein [Clostridiales bacterium]
SKEGKAELIKLKKELAYPQGAVVVSSPLKRCLETARILYPENEPAIIRGFAECDFGEFEGLTADELKPYPEFGEWLKGGEGAAPPHGESNREFKNRVITDFLRLIQGLLKTGTDSCVVITHGGVIMMLLSYFGIPELPMHEWLTPFGCGYTVRITPSIWSRINKFEVIAEIPSRQGKTGETLK